MTESWRGVGECAGRRQTLRKAGSERLSSSPSPKRWVVTMTPTRLTQPITCHAHKHARTHTRTHTEEHQGRIHEWPEHPGPWCAINKWQPAYWSNKNNGLKRNKTKTRSRQCINQVAVIKVNLPAFFGMLTDRQMLPESHGKQNETKITKWQYLFTAILFSLLIAIKKHKPKT